MTSLHGTSGYIRSMTYYEYVYLDLAGFSPLKAFRTSGGYSPSRASSAYPATITSADFTQALAYSDGMNRLTRAHYTETGRTTDPFGLVKIDGNASYTESVAYDLWSNPVRIRLHRPETVGIGGNTFGFTYDASGSLLQRTHYHPNYNSPLRPMSLSLDPVTPELRSFTDTVSYCGPFEYENGSLSRVNFPGGYVSGGMAYHYIHDHQGNVRQVVDATTGKVEQENHYYPGGMLFGESTATYFKHGSANNTYRYGGKELVTTGGLDLYQFGARMYDPVLLRFITPDPLRHETPWLSSYLYCAANPVMLVDPTGMSTRVVDNGNGTYRVTGGAFDGDLGIFLCESADSETGIPIGVTPVETSFYNSDTKEGGAWMVGAVIDSNDDSGINFINAILNDTPGVLNYSRNAYGGQPYDFKVTNGTETKDDDNRGHYRGMPIEVCRPPLLPVYSSARDIGNMMAGYVMGYNGWRWGVARKGFDMLESIQKGKESTEGASSQNAQKYGYRWGLNQRKESIRDVPSLTPGIYLFRFF